MLQKLGWGHFSTVWLAKDLKYNTFVALKIQKSAQNYLEAAFDEVEILEQVSTKWKAKEWQDSFKQYENTKEVNSDSCNCIQLLNSFVHFGPNGKHFVMVFEISGVNLLEVIKRYNYRGIPLPLVRIIAKQILIGLDYLHRVCRIIHTDLKPENVVLCLTQHELTDIITHGQFGTNKSTYRYGAGPLVLQPKAESGHMADNDTSAENADVKASELTEEKRKERKKQKKREKKKRLKKKKQTAKNKQQPAIEEIKPKRVPTKRGSNPELFNCLSNTRAAWESENTDKALNGEVKSFADRGKKRGPRLDKLVKVKIVDLGNGCWTYHHFTPQIQTRQYRSPEVILGAEYGCSADLWSLACMVFEMVTGDFLFDPRKGSSYSKNEDHLAQMVELLDQMPKTLALSGAKGKVILTNN